MGQLVLAVRPEAQPIGADPKPEVPLEPLLFPEVEPGHLLGGRHEELQLHLLELAQPEYRVARRDLVPKRLADLRDAEWRPHVRAGEDGCEAYGESLGRLRPHGGPAAPDVP